MVGVHVAALVSLFFEQTDEVDAAALVQHAIATSSSRDAIFVLTRDRYLENLLQKRRYNNALEICGSALHQKQIPLERFSLRDVAARCHLALGQKEQAYALARLALSDWHRVLEGLYTKTRKLDWLTRGVPCLNCAVECIRDAEPWITEHERRKALFALIELQKARLASDVMTQDGHLPGVYDLSEAMNSGGMSSDWFLSQSAENPDWTAICLLQMSPLISDVMTTVVHGDSGSQEVFPVDLAPLRSMLQLPIDPDKQLLATASALRFDGPDELYRDTLYADLSHMLSPGNSK